MPFPEIWALQEHHGQGLCQARVCCSPEPPAAPRRANTFVPAAVPAPVGSGSL